MSKTTPTTVANMLTEARAFRGELVEQPDPVVQRIRSAAHQLSWGATEEEVAEALLAGGSTTEEAFLAVKAAFVIVRGPQ